MASRTARVTEDATCDVLIVGAGSAGLMSANLLLRYGINIRIIDKNAIRASTGRTDCIQSRALEVLESMGLQYELDKKGCRISEYTFWNKNLQTGDLDRTNMGVDVISPSPYPWTLAADKSDLVETLETDIVRLGGRVEYQQELLQMSKPQHDRKTVAYIRNHKTGTIEKWSASFILGCDGTSSVIRNKLEIALKVFEPATSWVVADVSAHTDLPDYRRRCTIRSESGTCIITPRKEAGFRLRALLSSDDLKDPHWDMSHITDEVLDATHVCSSMGLLHALQTRISKAIAPYKFFIDEVSWVDQYSSPVTLANEFSDITSSVFLLGSACHTHSPMTKQTMNGGMMDALNLTWKLALVIMGSASRAILYSYEFERRSLLMKAVDFDYNLDQVLSMKIDDPELLTTFHNFEEANGYTSGCGVRYPPSNLVQEEVRIRVLGQSTEPLTPGKRLLPSKLLRHVDGNEVDILHISKPTGRFTLIYFVGDVIGSPVVKGMSNFLVSSESPLHFKVGDHGKPLLNIVMVHSIAHTMLQIQDIDHPWPQYAMNIFEDVSGFYHTKVGLKTAFGGLCLVRPDGYIAIVSNLDNTMAVTEYLRQMQMKV